MIDAKSGDVNLIQKINHSKLSGFVHSTFNRTFNIKCKEDGELYTIACIEMDNAPNTLVIEIDRFDEMGIEVNDLVYVENKILYIGNKIAVTIKRVENWESILPAYPNDLERMKTNVAIMKNYIDIFGKSGGIKKSIISQSPFEKEMSKMLEERIGLLFSEILNNNRSRALKHAVSLIGLGPGLTPSGDDFLVGLFSILNLQKSPLLPLKGLAEEVVNIAKSLTNEISYMALKKASNGHVRESIICLINSLLIGKEEELILSLNKVLNIGSSSGTDIATGIICGLELSITVGGRV